MLDAQGWSILGSVTAAGTALILIGVRDMRRLRDECDGTTCRKTGRHDVTVGAHRCSRCTVYVCGACHRAPDPPWKRVDESARFCALHRLFLCRDCAPLHADHDLTSLLGSDVHAFLHRLCGCPPVERPVRSAAREA